MGVGVEADTEAAKAHFIQGMARIAHFWGFPRTLGVVYGVIYLSPQSQGLDDLAVQAGISKGAVSTTVRNLERLGMVHKQIKVGDRRDYYVAETDFWKIVQSVLRQREHSEFSQALNAVAQSLRLVTSAEYSEADDLGRFYIQRLSRMKTFFGQIDNLVAMAVAMDRVRLQTLTRFLKAGGEDQME